MHVLVVTCEGLPRPTLSESLSNDLSRDGLEVAEVAASAATVQHLDDSAVLVLDGEPCASALFLAGYASARRIPIVLTTSDATTVQHPLRAFPWIDRREDDWRRQVVRAVRELLGLRPVEVARHLDEEAFRTWLADDPARFDTLGEIDLLRLASSLFADAPQRFGDVVASATRRFAFKCRLLPAYRRLEIEHVRQAATETAAAACDFSVLLTNSEPTPAARHLALASTPPVWVIDRWFLSEHLRRRAASVSGPQAGHILTAVSAWHRARGTTPMTARSVVNEGDATEWPDLWSSSVDRQLTAMLLWFNDTHDGEGAARFDTLRRRLADAKFRCQHFSASDRRSSGIGPQLVRALREAAKVIIVGIPNAREDSPSTYLTLQTLALEAATRLGMSRRCAVVAADTVWNRLSLPESLARCKFIDPAKPGWTEIVIATAWERPSDGKQEPSLAPRAGHFGNAS